MGIFLEKKDLKSAYEESERWTENWQKPFSEYERIAGNKLSKALSKNMPKVNDGSLAASLLETPMQVLPSMQTGKFNSTNKEQPWIDEVANIIWRNRIVPNANTQATFFDKEQIALYRALKYGAQPRYNFFVSNENYTGSDWSLPYIKNVRLEPGKYSVEDSDYIFLDVYYTKLQIKKIIESVKQDSANDTSWNVDGLKNLADAALTSKEIKEQNINEKEKQINASGIKTTICFNRGIGAPFYMFSKQLPEGEYLREWKNPDPTGDLPITMQFCYETLEGPFGIGRVELAGPTQNVLDYLTQAHILATQLGLQPPKKISGSIERTDMNSIVSAPDALWQLGDAQVDVVRTNSEVYTNFPSNYGLYKTQLQNLQGRTDGSVSATSGNPQFSKTPQGIKQQVERTNTQDNYLRNKADTASAKMATKMMNVHLAQMEGADILEIATEDKERLETLGFFDSNPDTVNTPELKEIEVLYDDLKHTFKFEFDPRPEADEDEKKRWLELIDIYASNPNLGPMLEQEGWKFDIGEAFKNVISNSGASNWEKILVKTNLTDEATGGVKLDENGQTIEQVAPMAQPVESTEETNIVPTEEPNLVDDIRETMNQYGVNKDIAQTIILSRYYGYPEEAIIKSLMENNIIESEVVNA